MHLVSIEKVKRISVILIGVSFFLPFVQSNCFPFDIVNILCPDVKRLTIPFIETIRLLRENEPDTFKASFGFVLITLLPFCFGLLMVAIRLKVEKFIYQLIWGLFELPASLFLAFLVSIFYFRDYGDILWGGYIFLVAYAIYVIAILVGLYLCWINRHIKMTLDNNLGQPDIQRGCPSQGMQRFFVSSGLKVGLNNGDRESDFTFCVDIGLVNFYTA